MVWRRLTATDLSGQCLIQNLSQGFKKIFVTDYLLNPSVLTVAVKTLAANPAGLHCAGLGSVRSAVSEANGRQAWALILVSLCSSVCQSAPRHTPIDVYARPSPRAPAAKERGVAARGPNSAVSDV